MEYHPDIKDEKGEVTKKSYHSFKLEAINSDNPYYEKLSEIVRDSGVDQDSAYMFTSQALELILELVEEGADIDDSQDRISEEADSQAPIYNYDLLQWLARGNTAVVEETISEYGWNKDYTLVGFISASYARAWENHCYTVIQALKELQG